MNKRVLTATLIAMLAGTTAWTQAQPATGAAPAKAAQPDKKDEKKDDKKEEKKTLKVGDKAPAISVEKWVKGEPVTGFEKGKVYVVEFWATWCGPCIASMPHISELQKKYKDKGLTVIGTNIWEDKTYSDTTFDKVKKFVDEKGDGMGYTVAYDGAAKAMDKNWMGAAGRNGIPTAFIVNQEGVVAFIGHPMKMDEPLEKIIAGKYDIKSAAEESKREADEAAKARDVNTQFQKAMELVEDGKFDDALTAIDKLMGKSKQLDLQLAATKFEILFTEKKDYAKAYALAGEVADKYKDNAMLLNNIAWHIVDPAAKVEKPDLDVAMKLSSRAVDKDPTWANLDTLARVHFLKGDLAKALETQKKAVESVKKTDGIPEQYVEELESRLKEYEKAGK